MFGRGRTRLSLRLRITAGALVAVLAACTAAGLVVLEVVEREMVSQIDSSLSATTDFIDRSLGSGEGLPTQSGPSDLYVQFIGPDGQVLGASEAAQGLPALAEPAGAGDGEPRIASADAPRVGRLRVLTQRLPADGTVTLVVARSAAGVSDVHDSLQRWLIALAAALTVALGIVIWVVVGRSLRPVEMMRRAVSTISDQDLRQRVDTPGTGDELDRLANTLNGLLARLDAALARERQFVAHASHELRTPIAGVRTLLETETADPVSVLGTRAEALATLGRLQDLVDELLVLAKTTEGAVHTIAAEPVDLDELVLEQARQLERSTDLRVDTRRVSGGQVLGDDAQLGRLIENLAANAARYAATTVAFAVEEVDDMVEFTVTDDGPGIAEADRVRVFERFTTLDDGRSRDRAGAGLGLAIAAAIAEAHHGSIAAGGGDEGGASFVVRIPAVSTVPVHART